MQGLLTTRACLLAYGLRCLHVAVCCCILVCVRMCVFVCVYVLSTHNALAKAGPHFRVCRLSGLRPLYDWQRSFQNREQAGTAAAAGCSQRAAARRCAAMKMNAQQMQRQRNIEMCVWSTTPPSPFGMATTHGRRRVVCGRGEGILNCT